MTAPAARAAPLAGILWGVTAAVAWAIYNVGAKVGTAQGFQPADLTLMRFLGAGLLMLLPLLRLGIHNLAGIGWHRGMTLTLLIGPLFALVVNTGFVLAPLAHGVVLGPTGTMLASTLLAWRLERERPSPAQLAGMAILLLGLLAIAYDGLGHDTGGAVRRGDLAFLGAGMLWGVFTYLLRRWRVNAVRGTAVVAVLSMLTFVPFYFATTSLPPVGAPALLLQLVCQGGLGGCLAVVAYSAAVRELGAGRASLFTAIVPALANLLAVPVLGQVPSALQLLGVALCSLGLLTALGLLARRPGRPRLSSTPP